MLRFGVILLVSSLALPGAAAAERVRFELDPEASKVAFTLGATLHDVHGSFRIDSGSIVVDLQTRKLDGTIVVDAASGETGNAKRDRKMHGNVLVSEQHPRVVLQAEQFHGTLLVPGVSKVELVVTLELLGQTHSLVVPFEVEIQDARLRGTAEFDVPYVEWGLEDPSAFLLRVAKIVGVSVEIVGSLEPIDPPSRPSESR